MGRASKAAPNKAEARAAALVKAKHTKVKERAAIGSLHKTLVAPQTRVRYTLASKWFFGWCKLNGHPLCPKQLLILMG